MKHLKYYDSISDAAGLTVESPVAVYVNGAGGSKFVESDGATTTINEDGKIDEPDYLCFTADGVASTVGLTNCGSNAPIIYYSFDKITWTKWTYSSISLVANQSVYMYGENTYVCESSNKFSTFEISNYTKVSGNIMSLLNKVSSITIDHDCCFYLLFNWCKKITSAPKLPATTLSNKCYYNMFNTCESLTVAPNLPATTLTNYCYSGMFGSCTSLTTAPKLHATTLANSCYSYMFESCTSLTTAPELPATNLVANCYYGMFMRCSSLVVAPELPATTLAGYCYADMFYQCTNLTTAPVLPATILTLQCYNAMFYSCNKLNYIKCYATDISATYCLNNWLSSVSSTGDFYKDSNTTYPSGISGIPSGWTIHNIE